VDHGFGVAKRWSKCWTRLLREKDCLPRIFFGVLRLVARLDKSSFPGVPPRHSGFASLGLRMRPLRLYDCNWCEGLIFQRSEGGLEDTLRKSRFTPYALQLATRSLSYEGFRAKRARSRGIPPAKLDLRPTACLAGSTNGSALGEETSPPGKPCL
jgi:hypothetical protein